MLLKAHVLLTSSFKNFDEDMNAHLNVKFPSQKNLLLFRKMIVLNILTCRSISRERRSKFWWSPVLRRIWAFVGFSLSPDTLGPVSLYLPNNRRETDDCYPLITLIIWPNKVKIKRVYSSLKYNYTTTMRGVLQQEKCSGGSGIINALSKGTKIIIRDILFHFFVHSIRS